MAYGEHTRGVERKVLCDAEKWIEEKRATCVSLISRIRAYGVADCSWVENFVPENLATIYKIERTYREMWIYWGHEMQNNCVRQHTRWPGFWHQRTLLGTENRYPIKKISHGYQKFTSGDMSETNFVWSKL